MRNRTAFFDTYTPLNNSSRSVFFSLLMGILRDPGFPPRGCAFEVLGAGAGPRGMVTGLSARS